MPIFAVKVTGGQEENITRLLQAKITIGKIPIKSIVTDKTRYRGYIFIECNNAIHVDQIIKGLRHTRGRLKGLVDTKEMLFIVNPKPLGEVLKINDKVEIISGPLRGMEAIVLGIEKDKKRIQIQVLESQHQMPLTIHATSLKLVRT